jgi:hypothetical protein
VKLQRDLREFIELLISNGVDAVIVDAHALAYHGHPRFTGDIDILVRPTVDNADRLVAALEAFGFGDSGLGREDFIRPGRVIQLGQPPNRIDLLTSVTGVDIEEIWAGRVAGELDGLPVFFIGRAELIRNKRATGRPQDAADVATLERRGTSSPAGD